jgi:hypothetical protein
MVGFSAVFYRRGRKVAIFGIRGIYHRDTETQRRKEENRQFFKKTKKSDSFKA